MKGFFKLFRPDPHIEEIQDSKVVAEQYHYWRIRILYSMFIGYAFYYFTRKSLTFAAPGIIADLGYTKSQIGMLGSIWSITYGVSKFASGVLSDRSNPRYFMAIGLMITGVLNILFGLTSSLLVFAFLWGLNGWFQGFGWPPCAKFLTHWYSHSERGSWWSTWNVSHNVGAFTIPWIVGAAVYYFDWRFAMCLPGVLCIMGGFFLINRLRDTPQSLGLPPIEEFRNDYTGNQVQEDQLSTKEILVEYVLKNKYIWLLAVSSFFVYVVRSGIDWANFFLIETKGYSQLKANGCVSLFEVGGFFGSLAAGWSSDRFFGARRGPVNVLFALMAVASLSAFWFVPQGYAGLDSMAMFFIGFSIFGPQMLIGVAAAELSHKKAAATATGFTGTFAYLGSAFAGYPLSTVIQSSGWNGFFWVMVACCMVSVLLLIPMWDVTNNKRLAETKIKTA